MFHVLAKIEFSAQFDSVPGATTTAISPPMFLILWQDETRWIRLQVKRHDDKLIIQWVSVMKKPAIPDKKWVSLNSRSSRYVVLRTVPLPLWRSCFGFVVQLFQNRWCITTNPVTNFSKWNFCFLQLYNPTPFKFVFSHWRLRDQNRIIIE